MTQNVEDLVFATRWQVPRELGEAMQKSGVALLDRVLGGLVPGFPVVLTGPTGAGRTVLCLQLTEQFTRRGLGVVFLTGEPVRLLLRQAVSMDLDLTTPLREERLVLLELDPQVATTARVHGGEALVEAVGQAASQAQLVVIDPLTALTSEIIDEVALRALVRAIFDASAASEQIVVVTVEAEALHGNPALERVLKEACGAFIELTPGQNGVHVLTVTKSRTAGPMRGPARFQIGSGGTIPVNADDDDPQPVTAAATPAAALGRARVAWSDIADFALNEASKRQPEPPAAETLKAEKVEPKEKRETRPARSCVLVVEDDRFTRETLCDWLSEQYQVITAEDGFGAISAVMAYKPELVVLDLILPRVDGFEVLRSLRQSGQLQPILVVSGNLKRASDRVRALVLGATDLMHKPVQRFELLQKIETLSKLSLNPPTDYQVADAEELLGGLSMRILEEEPFRDRLERACRFGSQFDLPSALTAVEAPSADALDRLVAAAEKLLRAEDAVLMVSKRQALLLLVSTETSVVPQVLSRFRNALSGRRGPGLRGFRWNAVQASPDWQASEWAPLFEKLRPWPGEEPEATED